MSDTWDGVMERNPDWQEILELYPPVKELWETSVEFKNAVGQLMLTVEEARESMPPDEYLEFLKDARAAITEWHVA